MANMSSYVPGFKTACTIIGATYTALAGTMLLGGVHQMGQFGVPESTLSSAHFADMHHWTFVHMAVIGVLITLLGRYVERASGQLVVARVLLVLALHYTYLDLRTSDAVGSGLYSGRAWVVPVLVDLLVTLTFAYLSFSGRSRRPETVSV